MVIELKDLLDVWGIDEENPDYENYVKRAEERIAEMNSPKEISKRNKARDKSNNKYRRAKIRR